MPIHLSKSKRTLIVLAVGVGIVTLILLTPSPAPATPTITWMPSSVNQTILAGKSQSVSVSFIPSKDFSNVNVRVVPELAPYVQVFPAAFSSIAKGQPVTLNLIISAPETSAPGTFQGTVQLKNGTGANAKTFARPLPVSVNVIWQIVTDTGTGVSFGLPPALADIATIAGQQTADRSVIDVKLASTIDGVPESQFSIGLQGNPNHLDLSAWFQENIDLDGSLLSTGVYVPETFVEGLIALVQRQPLPTDDQIAPIFAISPSGSTIITLSPSQINDLGSYGYTTASSRMSFLLAVLQTINVP